jgi:hypothetical protein
MVQDRSGSNLSSFTFNAFKILELIFQNQEIQSPVFPGAFFLQVRDLGTAGTLFRLDSTVLVPQDLCSHPLLSLPLTSWPHKSEGWNLGLAHAWGLMILSL